MGRLARVVLGTIGYRRDVARPAELDLYAGRGTQTWMQQWGTLNYWDGNQLPSDLVASAYHPHPNYWEYGEQAQVSRVDQGIGAGGPLLGAVETTDLVNRMLLAWQSLTQRPNNLW